MQLVLRSFSRVTNFLRTAFCGAKSRLKYFGKNLEKKERGTQLSGLSSQFRCVLSWSTSWGKIIWKLILILFRVEKILFIKIDKISQCGLVNDIQISKMVFRKHWFTISTQNKFNLNFEWKVLSSSTLLLTLIKSWGTLNLKKSISICSDTQNNKKHFWTKKHFSVFQTFSASNFYIRFPTVRNKVSKKYILWKK